MHVDGPNNTTFEMNTRADLVTFIYALCDDLKEHPENWENRDLPTYLGALAAFLSDSRGYYKNQGFDVDVDSASWRLLADCLQAASVYD